MTKLELYDRINYIKGACEGKYSNAQAASAIHLSVSRVKVLKQKYKLLGDKAFIHGNTGKKGHHSLPDELKSKIVSLYKERFVGYNFAFYHEYLGDTEDIHIAYRSVYNILTNAGIKSPEERRVPRKKKVHRPRCRRENEGDMIQSDATPFDWFKIGHKQALHGAIDDATGKITGLYMCENECIYGYQEVMRQTIENHGRPNDFYSDKSAIFCVTPKRKNEMTIQEQLACQKEKKTQWQDILAELGINQILAHSPQAKGRIERLWRTLKGRLPWYFMRRGIHSPDQANIFFQEFIAIFNARFARKAKSDNVFYRPAPEFLNIDDCLSVKIPRKTDTAGGFVFHGYRFRVNAPLSSRKDFVLYISEKHGFRAKLGGQYYSVTLIDSIQDCIGDTMPQVLENLAYKYMYSEGKSVSA